METKEKLQMAIIAVVGISLPIIAITLLSAIVWAVTGLSYLLSLIIVKVVVAIFGYGLYRALLREVREFNVNIDFEDGEEDLL